MKEGDANGDGTVDIMDVIAANKVILGMKELTDALKAAADMDHNGRQTSNLYTIVSEGELQELLRGEKRRNDEEYILLGVAKLDDINESLDISIESEDYDSIAGHIISLFGYFPETGETISDEFAEYTVIEAEKNRIDKVRLRLLGKEPEPEEEISPT